MYITVITTNSGLYGNGDQCAMHPPMRVEIQAQNQGTFSANWLRQKDTVTTELTSLKDTL